MVRRQRRLPPWTLYNGQMEQAGECDRSLMGHIYQYRSVFPTIRPVRPDNMNYAICVAAFIGLFSTAWWFAGARKTYVGPRTSDTIDMLPPEDPEDILGDYDLP